MKEFDPTFTSWGPFINHENFIVQPVTTIDLVVASIVFGLTIVFAITAAWSGWKQTKRSRNPWGSAYIWMLWLEWISCVIIAVECILYLVRVIRPSFYFFMSLLILWTIQTQCLLQIIINRIRIILHNRRRGKQLMYGFLVLMTTICVSVFCIWIPARCQINATYMHINEVWDRLEKGIYLLMDAFLNYYFIKTVKENLVANGLHKYDKLVKFNQVIIIVSLLMDVLIIGAMSIPNGLVYAIFHPLAYLVKLNIEMSMARLIKKIALSTNNPNNHEHFQSYTSTDDPNTNSSRGGKLSTWIERRKRKMFSSEPSRQSQFKMDQGTIKKTAEFTVTSSPKGAIELSSHLRGDDKTSQVHIVAQERSLSGSPPDRTGSRLATRQDGDQHVKDYTSDEEVLIKPPQARARVRTSQDSFATQSMASEKVYRS